MIFSLISAGLAIASSAVTAITAAVSTIGPAVGTFAAKVAPVIGSVVAKLPGVLSAITPWVDALSIGLKLFTANEQVEDVGDRALQAATHNITPDKFDDFDQYMAALRDFKLDPSASEATSLAAKVVSGMAVVTRGLEDKFDAVSGSLNNIWFLPLANPDYFTPERVQGWLEHGRTLDDSSAYLNKALSGQDMGAFQKTLEITPNGKPMDNIELRQLYDGLDNARANWADLQQRLKDMP